MSYNTIMINTGIIEDDKDAADGLTEHLAHFGTEHGLEFNISVFETADEFLRNYSKIYDIVFVDIELPGIDGMSAAKKLRETDNEVIIIFVTNVSRLAALGYSVGALDYILKPIENYPFIGVMDRAMRMIERKRGISVSVNTSDGLFCLDSSAILYVEAYGHYIIYHTESGQISEWGSLKKPEELLTPHGFARCSSCYLVNMKYVRNIVGLTVTVGDKMLKMSRTRARTFLQTLNEFLGK